MQATREVFIRTNRRMYIRVCSTVYSSLWLYVGLLKRLSPIVLEKNKPVKPTDMATKVRYMHIRVRIYARSGQKCVHTDIYSIPYTFKCPSVHLSVRLSVCWLVAQILDVNEDSQYQD